LFLVDQFKITDSRCLLEKVEEKRLTFLRVVAGEWVVAGDCFLSQHKLELSLIFQNKIRFVKVTKCTNLDFKELEL